MTDVIESQSLQPSAAAFLDHIFVKGDLAVLDVDIKDSDASDHPAVAATLRWKENAEEGR